MATLQINPRHEALLKEQGLMTPCALLSLPGLIINGHPDRNVARVVVGGAWGRTAYLKRQHRVRWRERLLNAVMGFGFVPRSLREGRTLAELRSAGIPGPEVLACGEDDQGHAFLLIQSCEGIDLRQWLRDPRNAGRRSRVRLARKFGRLLARVHAAGFLHGDLYAKHVLVDPATTDLVFLDWQRARRLASLQPRHRLTDLAALDATLTEGLVSERERGVCLRAYLRASGLRPEEAVPAPWAAAIRQHSGRLLRKRHIRKERTSPPPLPTEGVLWLGGEHLCVTQEFWDETGGQVEQWLPPPEAHTKGMTRLVIPLPHGREGLLIRRQGGQPLAWIGALVRGKALRSPEIRQAGELFRRQKHDQPGPRVLAFGQHIAWPWHIESFLLTEISPPSARRAA